MSSGGGNRAEPWPLVATAHVLSLKLPLDAAWRQAKMFI
jgi:hypothetical protein